MDPKIIPFGWGLFGEQDEVIVIETGGISLKIFYYIKTDSDPDSVEMKVLPPS